MATASTPARWKQIPALPPRGPVPIIVPWLITAVPLWLQFTRLWYTLEQRILVVGVAAVSLLLIKWRPAALIPVVLLGSGVLVFPFGLHLGAHIAPLVYVPLITWALALRCFPGPYRWVPTGERLYPALLPLGPAAISLARYTAFRFAMICLVMSGLLTLAAMLAPGPFERAGLRLERLFAPLHRLLVPVAHVLGKVVGAIMMIPAAIVVMLAWFGQRVFRYDPLGSRSGVPDSTWVRRSGEDPIPAHLFSQVRPSDRERTGVVLRRMGASITSLAVAAAAVAVIVLGPSGVVEPVPDLFAPKCGPPPPDEAMDEDEHWPDLACEIGEFQAQGRFDATTTYTMADYDGEYIKVKDGVRETWRAPECDCKRVKAWMFGGSAAFGWWQRGDYTIASQLAKKAWDDGVALDIDVIAMPGWVAGQEVRKFAEMAVTEDPPDLAIFYNGGNDLNRQKDRNSIGRGADESETSFAEEEVNVLLSEGPFPWTPAEFEAIPPEDPDPILEPDEVADHAMNRYLRNLEQARRSADAAGITPIFVWQPVLPSAPVERGNFDALAPEDRVFWEGMLAEALPRLPEDVIDLSDSLDEVEGAVFKDIWHTNERASDVVAGQLYEQIQDQIEAAAR